jgi:hypothetical protein
VHRFGTGVRAPLLKVGVVAYPINEPDDGAVLTYEAARTHLWAKVRMETPVIYFYSSKEVSANVHVRFPRGLLTEWYPQAATAQPTPSTSALRAGTYVSQLSWAQVRVLPGADEAYPRESGESHYYAARATDAAPLGLEGQREKFLFYRGIASFDVPVATVPTERGVRVRNLGADPLGGVVLFENRGGAIGYRVLDGTIPARGEATLETPRLDGTIIELALALERSLVRAGLYPREAKAMVETWRDSWFEEGTRVFYLVPPRAVDDILALTIRPAPVQTTRVFVGRMEVLAPWILSEVENAYARGDLAALGRYGRFLGPITERLIQASSDVNLRVRTMPLTNRVFASYLSSGIRCQ